MIEESSVEQSQCPDVRDMKVSILAILFTILGCFFYIIDVSFDIIVANRHYNDGHIIFFYLTVAFIVLPALLMTGFSMKIYSDSKELEKSKQFNDTPSNKRWIMRVLLVLFLAPVLRNFEAFYYAFKYWKSSKHDKQHQHEQQHQHDKQHWKSIKQYYAKKYICENTNAAFLRLIEAFLECGPQLILQIYILAISQSSEHNQSLETGTTQKLSIVFSVLSMSTAIIAYERFLRTSSDDKRESPWYVSSLPWLWRVFELSSRCIAFGLFASAVLPEFFWAIFLLHILCLTCWRKRSMNTEFYDYDQCPFRCGEYFYDLIMGVILIFCYFHPSYFNPKDTPSKDRMKKFYIAVFIDNTILMMPIWYHYDLQPTIIQDAAVFQVVGFFISIVLMVNYYYFLHPTVGECYKESTSSHHSANNINANISENDIVVSGYQNDEIGENIEILTQNGFCEKSKKRKENGVRVEY